MCLIEESRDTHGRARLCAKLARMAKRRLRLTIVSQRIVAHAKRRQKENHGEIKNQLPRI